MYGERRWRPIPSQLPPRALTSRRNLTSPSSMFPNLGDLAVLDDVSFFVNPGETLCILGRSGVGKSVSLQTIMGFLKPDTGRIWSPEKTSPALTKNR